MDLIGELELGKATNNNQPEYNRASEVIRSILTEIDSDNSYYASFC